MIFKYLKINFISLVGVEGIYRSWLLEVLRTSTVKDNREDLHPASDEEEDPHSLKTTRKIPILLRTTKWIYHLDHVFHSLHSVVVEMEKGNLFTHHLFFF